VSPRTRAGRAATTASGRPAAIPGSGAVADQHAPWDAVGLTQQEYRRIARALGRAPAPLELGMLGAMWSEHCSYKSSKVHLRRLPTDGDAVLVGPGENAGVLALPEGWAVAIRVESHNHPSAVEPFQGAATGVGGILRDIFATGARPCAVLDGLCFGPPAEERARALLRGVVEGIAHYGNSIGVPTVGGCTSFGPAYRDNPLVNVMAAGWLRADAILHGRASGPGNPLLLVGNRTGRDGIHGASLLASRSFAGSPADMRPAVQVGDPFVGKLLLESCLELAERGLLLGCNDLGAAGLTSASAEAAGRGGMGVELDLDAVPRREEGMSPYEVMLSESQERMLLVVDAADEAAAVAVCRRWGCEVARVGRVTADGRIRVRAGGEVVADMPVSLLTAAAPRYRRPARRPAAPVRARIADADVTDAGGWLRRLLASPNVCSRRWIYRQYDHQVQTATVVLPGQGDAAVLWRKGTGFGVALALDGSGRLTRLDPYGGAALAVCEAARNVACAGGRPLGLTNCLNWGSPEDPATMGSFVAAVAGMARAARALGIPVTGGNVSFYNETRDRPVDPTPLVGVAGLVADVDRRRGSGFPEPGLTVALLGPAAGRLDGSEYQVLRWGEPSGAPARPDFHLERGLLRVLAQASLRSAHDCAEGGLLVCLAECVLTGAAGAAVRLPRPRGRLDELLFGEAPGRVVVSTEDYAGLSALCREAGVPVRRLGVTTAARELAAEGLGTWPLREEGGLEAWLG
jgi:phosphoribosylformylglycinamidine synthase II